MARVSYLLLGYKGPLSGLLYIFIISLFFLEKIFNFNLLTLKSLGIWTRRLCSRIPSLPSGEASASLDGSTGKAFYWQLSQMRSACGSLGGMMFGFFFGVSDDWVDVG